MNRSDSRWIQRLDSFSKALNQLTRFIERIDLNEMEQQGLIQSFEYTYELAWNTMNYANTSNESAKSCIKGKSIGRVTVHALGRERGFV